MLNPHSRLILTMEVCIILYSIIHVLPLRSIYYESKKCFKRGGGKTRYFWLISLSGVTGSWRRTLSGLTAADQPWGESTDLTTGSLTDEDVRKRGQGKRAVSMRKTMKCCCEQRARDGTRGPGMRDKPFVRKLQSQLEK